MVFLIASSVYIITSEPTMSFWDCGEYISTAFKLEVGHPPGAPLFQLIGRFFTFFAFGDLTLVARMVNTMSALASGFTILFLFWTITMIAKKILNPDGKELTEGKIYQIMGAGLVGALAYTFTDSFWFSAVEGEVYAMSSFFTAIVFWAIFKWDEHADDKHAFRWLILIAYLMGLSVGVHLLNLLAIPAITLVYYFKKFPAPTWKGIFLAFVFSIGILAFVMYIIIPWVVNLAGLFELFFVNSIGMPFNSGTIIYCVLLLGFIVLGLYYTRKTGKAVLNSVILAFAFILIGYTSFLVLIIRSNANTPIDENNPENAMYLLAYLNREQYGDWPLLKGQYYNAPTIDRKDGTPVYTKDIASGKYLVTDKREKIIPVYDPRFTTVFPRMWANMEKKYVEDYKRWGRVQGTPVEIQGEEKTETRYIPTFSENLRFFWDYQVVHMYYRYFMWNFAGKQNDNQGTGNKIDGNWKSGIPFYDKWRLGSQDIPEIRKSKADNSFYFLPLILGLFGLFFTFKKDYRSTIVIGLLFLMTGLAIVIYLNQYSPQPRERDYAYAGSFYAFAIWIGLGVLQLSEWLNKKLNLSLSAIIATLASLVLVPGIMAQQGWDDHDRSGRYTALALAENYLNSCPPNAILFTNGDNDTFPLWYAQEVEGIRTDVRVANLSLLNTDWYIDQLKRKAYNSDPVPFSISREKYRQGSHDVTYIVEDDVLKNQYLDLKVLFNIINTDDSRLKLNTQQYGMFDYFPSRKFFVGQDPPELLKKGYVPAKYASQVRDTLKWEMKLNAIEKNNLMIMDLLAHNNWKRPVCFASTMGTETYIGLEKYFFLEGLAFRLLPVASVSKDGQIGEVNSEVMYDNLMNKFKWGNMQNPKTYMDENNLRMSMNFRNAFGRLADELIREGKKDSAQRVLDRCMEVMPGNLIPMNYFSTGIIEGYFKIGDTKKAADFTEQYFKLLDEDLAYLFSFPDNDLKSFEISLQEDLMSMDKLKTMTSEYKQEALGKKIDNSFQKYYQLYVEKVYQK